MANVEHNTLAGTANQHGILRATVADATALAAVTPSATDVSQRRVWLQTDTGQLWVPQSTTAGDFVPMVTPASASPQALGVAAVGNSTKFARENHVHVMPRLDQVSAPTASVGMNSQKLTGMAAGTAANDGATLSNSLDQFAAAAADVSLASHKLTNVANPASAQDAETKAYGDSRLQMFGAWSALSAPATASTRFLDFNNPRDTPQTAATSSNVAMPMGGTIVAGYSQQSSVLSTDTVTVTIQKNSVDTAVTWVIAAGSGTGHVTGVAVTFAAGDFLTCKVVQSSTQAQAAWGITVMLAYKSSDTG